jgi:hypothetical protein
MPFVGRFLAHKFARDDFDLSALKTSDITSLLERHRLAPTHLTITC